jgi:hypothetical protein
MTYHPTERSRTAGPWQAPYFYRGESTVDGVTSCAAKRMANSEVWMINPMLSRTCIDFMTASRDALHPNAVHLALETTARKERHQPSPAAAILSEHAQARDVAVQAHQLDNYDQLTAEDHDEEPT